MKQFFLMLILPLSAQAFTLNNNFEAAFEDHDVKVSIDENTTCLYTGLTIDELSSLVKPAVRDFWNTVPTSSLHLEDAGTSRATDNMIEDAGASLIPPVNGIIIACNDSASNFEGKNILAVTVPNNFEGKKIKGAVILINDTQDSGFKKLSRKDKISVIAHEIGHAIGLGHSEDNAALMYYRTVKQRKKLGQDDIDGVSYLYPVHVDGCGAFGGLFGGTIKKNEKEDDQNFPYWPLAISFAAMIGVFEFIRLMKNFRLPRRA
jgi:hypothetical protein